MIIIKFTFFRKAKIIFLYLNIRDGRFEGARPVDQSIGPVNDPLLVKPEEAFLDGSFGTRIHGEANPVPVKRRTHFLELLVNTATFSGETTQVS